MTIAIRSLTSTCNYSEECEVLTKAKQLITDLVKYVIDYSFTRTNKQLSSSTLSCFFSIFWIRRDISGPLTLDIDLNEGKSAIAWMHSTAKKLLPDYIGASGVKEPVLAFRIIRSGELDGTSVTGYFENSYIFTDTSLNIPAMQGKPYAVLI